MIKVLDTLAHEAIRLNPVAENYFLLSQICDRLNARSDALAAVERAIELAPDHLEYYQFHQEIRESK